MVVEDETKGRRGVVAVEAATAGSKEGWEDEEEDDFRLIFEVRSWRVGWSIEEAIVFSAVIVGYQREIVKFVEDIMIFVIPMYFRVDSAGTVRGTSWCLMGLSGTKIRPQNVRADRAVKNKKNKNQKPKVNHWQESGFYVER
jgi:hypothetical protein